MIRSGGTSTTRSKLTGRGAGNSAASRTGNSEYEYDAGDVDAAAVAGAEEVPGPDDEAFLADVKSSLSVAVFNFDSGCCG